MLHHHNRQVRTLRRKGRQLTLALHQGRQIYPGKRMTLPQLDYRMAEDSTGFWLEVGFDSPEVLVGSAASGWHDARDFCRISLQQSTDLQTWQAGMFGDCPGSPTDDGDGGWMYWSRAAVPAYWQEVMVDLTATTTLWGKSITGLSALGVAISLPGYPYAMPAAAATLQAHLRTAGFTGATVTSSAGTLGAVIHNYTPSSTQLLHAAMTGSNVTAVSWAGATIPLTGYPYAMPSQQAALQAALRSAGYDGAVVVLTQDTWMIVLPDRLTTGMIRQFIVSITPGDPSPVLDMYGNYVGLNSADIVTGSSGHLRDPAGAPLLEAGKQFARMAVTRGTGI